MSVGYVLLSSKLLPATGRNNSSNLQTSTYSNLIANGTNLNKLVVFSFSSAVIFSPTFLYHDSFMIGPAMWEYVFISVYSPDFVA